MASRSISSIEDRIDKLLSSFSILAELKRSAKCFAE
jgi:hypothetical protein